MDREAFVLLPSLNGSHLALEMSGYLLPGVEPVVFAIAS